MLDGNDRGSPRHRGGYPIYVGPEQVTWLKEELERRLDDVLERAGLLDGNAVAAE